MDVIVLVVTIVRAVVIIPANYHVIKRVLLDVNQVAITLVQEHAKMHVQV